MLRLFHADWRRPITRTAEAITVFALIIAGLMIMVDLGRPERVINFIFYGRIESPFMWDVIVISVYLLSCIFFILLPLIPDMGNLKDHKEIKGFRKKIYKVFSFGWTGSDEQKKRLEKAIGIMTVVIIIVAISAHTVVAWIFGVTVRPMWHSSILGPYFIVAAIFSGIAVLILTLAIVRKAYNLENFITPKHFNYLGKLLIVMSLLWFYFTFF